MPRRRLTITLLAACAVAPLSACLNNSDTLANAGPDPLPDLQPAATPGAPTRSAGPSVTGLDRRNWQVVQVAAPRGQVQRQPTYDEPLVLNGGSARNGDTFPTTADAMKLGSDPGAAASEGALEAGWPAVMLVLSPVRMVLGEPPWLTMQSPQQASGVLPPSQVQGAPGLWVWVASDPRSGAGAP
jgi:hypothetical protein